MPPLDEFGYEIIDAEILWPEILRDDEQAHGTAFLILFANHTANVLKIAMNMADA